MAMRFDLPITFALLLAGAALLASPARANGAANGSVRLLSPSPMLTESSTGDRFVRVDSRAPARLLLAPGRYVADVRVNLPAGVLTETMMRAVTVEVVAAGRTVGRFTFQPRLSALTWSNDPSMRSSTPIGFVVFVAARAEPWEFRVDEMAARGIALRLVPEGSASRRLPDTAPVVHSNRHLAMTTGAPLPASAEGATVHTVTIAPFPQEAIDLRGHSAFGAGLALHRHGLATAEASPVIPFFDVRVWLGERYGMRARAGGMFHNGLARVSSSPDGEPGTASRTAPGHAYEGELALGVFWHVARTPRSAFYLAASGGPVVRKDLRLAPAAGAGGSVVAGVELPFGAIPSVGFTLDGGIQFTSFGSARLGSAARPVMTGTFHYYFGR